MQARRRGMEAPGKWSLVLKAGFFFQVTAQSSSVDGHHNESSPDVDGWMEMLLSLSTMKESRTVLSSASDSAESTDTVSQVLSTAVVASDSDSWQSSPPASERGVSGRMRGLEGAEEVVVKEQEWEPTECCKDKNWQDKPFTKNGLQ